MDIHRGPWTDTAAAVRRTWCRLRAANPALYSPYFAWEFFDAVARATGTLELAVFRSGGADVGYLPFHRVGRGGSPMSAFEGVVAAPSFVFDPLAFLDACGWTPSRSTTRSRRDCPGRRTSAAGRSGFGRLKELRRVLRRAHGAVRFEWDVRDPGVFEELLVLKSAQYVRTMGDERDLFAKPVMPRSSERSSVPARPS